MSTPFPSQMPRGKGSLSCALQAAAPGHLQGNWVGRRNLRLFSSYCLAWRWWRQGLEVGEKMQAAGFSWPHLVGAGRLCTAVCVVYVTSPAHPARGLSQRVGWAGVGVLFTVCLLHPGDQDVETEPCCWCSCTVLAPASVPCLLAPSSCWVPRLSSSTQDTQLPSQQ